MSALDVITTILTSALVSSIVAFLLRIIFENRQQHLFTMDIERLKHVYEMQLEQLKADMTLNVDIQRGLLERRLATYPKLAELIYRARNICREVANSGTNPVLADEFQARVRELEDLLYASRIDLERDGLFARAHGYKNLLKAFGRAINDISILQSQAIDPHDVERMKEELLSTYRRIEVAHRSLIDDISAKVSTTEPDATS